MKIFYGLTRDGKHLQAHAVVPNGELTAAQREVLVEVFATLTEHTINENPTPPVPSRVGDYVLIKRGVEDGRCFADYARRNS